MKRKRGWRCAKLVGKAMIWLFTPMGGIHFYLPPPSVIQQWPAEGGIWTPEPQLSRKERRAWAAIEASLREVEGWQ